MTRYHVVEETSGGAEILASYPSAGQALKTAATITAPTSVGVLVYVIDDAGHIVRPGPAGQRGTAAPDDGHDQPGLWGPNSLTGQEAIPTADPPAVVEDLAVVDELGEDVEDLADNDPDVDMVALAVGQGVLW